MTTSPTHNQTPVDHYPNRYTPVPPNGQKCEFTGLNHARLYQLLRGLARKHVRVASIKEPGTKRGTRLFHAGDMLRFLDGLAVEQTHATGEDHP